MGRPPVGSLNWYVERSTSKYIIHCILTVGSSFGKLRTRFPLHHLSEVPLNSKSWSLYWSRYLMLVLFANRCTPVRFCYQNQKTIKITTGIGRPALYFTGIYQTNLKFRNLIWKFLLTVKPIPETYGSKEYWWFQVPKSVIFIGILTILCDWRRK